MQVSKTCIHICKAARLLWKDVYSRARRATGRCMVASASRVYHRKSHLFHLFVIKAKLKLRPPCVISSRADCNIGDKVAAAINHLYRAQGDRSRSRLRIGVLFRECRRRLLSHDIWWNKYLHIRDKSISLPALQVRELYICNSTFKKIREKCVKKLEKLSHWDVYFDYIYS